MAYVRKSKSRGKEYRQVVESYREDGKVKQRVLVHLGRFDTPEEAAEWHEAEAEANRSREARSTKEVNALQARRLPGRRLVWARKRAEDYARQAEKHEAKARVIRALFAEGKITPDAPEVREERERQRQEWLARVAQWR